MYKPYYICLFAFIIFYERLLGFWQCTCIFAKLRPASMISIRYNAQSCVNFSICTHPFALEGISFVRPIKRTIAQNRNPSEYFVIDSQLMVSLRSLFVTFQVLRDIFVHNSQGLIKFPNSQVFV